MQRGFSIVIETFACALVLLARARMARKAARRNPARGASAPYRYF